MGREHYIYMNGSSGCMPDTLGVSFDIEGCVSLFESIFGDDLYTNFYLGDYVDSGSISMDDVVFELAKALGVEEDELETDDPENEDGVIDLVDDFLNDGCVAYNDKEVLVSDLFGSRIAQLRIADFRDTGYISLGEGFGADYASWSPCTCDSPWEHSEDSEEYWLRENGDEWFTEHFELKIRYDGDNLPWERIEPLCLGWSEKLTEQEMEWLITERFVDNDRRVIREVRWNWEGVSQGHYFIPKYEEEGE